MSHRITFGPGVNALIFEQARYLCSEGAGKPVVIDWLARLYDKVDALRDHPRLYPKAELVSKALGYEVRRLNHGEYAVFYRVDDHRRVVEILDFRHGRRRPTTDLPSH